MLFLQFNMKEFLEEVGFWEQHEYKIIERFGVSDMVCGLEDSLVVATG